jgi:hypothetical protein
MESYLADADALYIKIIDNTNRHKKVNMKEIRYKIPSNHMKKTAVRITKLLLSDFVIFLFLNCSQCFPRKSSSFWLGPKTNHYTLQLFLCSNTTEQKEHIMYRI